MSVADEQQSPEDEAPTDIVSPADTMPPWIPRAIGLFFVGVIVLWVLRELFADLSGFLVTILISGFFSFALEPAVNFLERKGFRRSVGTLMMFITKLTEMNTHVLY